MSVMFLKSLLQIFCTANVVFAICTLKYVSVAHNGFLFTNHV